MNKTTTLDLTRHLFNFSRVYTMTYKKYNFLPISFTVKRRVTYLPYSVKGVHASPIEHLVGVANMLFHIRY